MADFTVQTAAHATADNEHMREQKERLAAIKARKDAAERARTGKDGAEEASDER